MSATELYPLFLKLAGRSVLVVGAGAVAERKIVDLHASGARVYVVAPRATEGVRAMAARQEISWSERQFRSTDTDDVWLIVSATDDPAAQRAAFEAGEARRIFVLAIDDLPNGSAYSAAVIRRPPLVVAISSSGEAPALARLLREMLEDLLPGDDWVALAQDLRTKWRTEKVPMGERFGRLVRAFKLRAEKAAGEGG